MAHREVRPHNLNRHGIPVVREPRAVRRGACLRKDFYTSRALAEASAIYFRAALGRGIPLRAYPCTDCRGWHLTSRR